MEEGFLVDFNFLRDHSPPPDYSSPPPPDYNSLMDHDSMFDFPVGRVGSPALSDASLTSTDTEFTVDSQATMAMEDPDDHWGLSGGRVRDLWTSQG